MCSSHLLLFFFFFFNDTATTEIYTLSLHDALPICLTPAFAGWVGGERLVVVLSPWLLALLGAALGWLAGGVLNRVLGWSFRMFNARSEEHTSELQSRRDLVCRLLLEKKKQNTNILI